MSVSTVVKTTSSLAQSAWSELTKKWTDFLSGDPKSWLKLVLEWVKNTKTGKLAAGILSLMILRPMTDKIIRYFKRYPPGTIGFVPLLSTITMIDEDNTDFWLNEPSKYGPISMHYLGFSPFVVINDRETAELLFNESLVNRDSIVTKEERNRMDELYMPLVGASDFVSVNEESNWSGRRKKFVRAQGALLKSDTLRNMIAQYFEDKLAPKIKDGKIWKRQREDLMRMSFNTMFHFGFGSMIERTEEEMDRFISDVQEVFVIFRLFLLGRSFGVSRIGFKIVEWLAGDKGSRPIEMKQKVRQWFERFKDSPDRSEAQYAEWLLNWVDDGGISFDHANSDLSTLFLAGTHTSVANTEQMLMHCARNAQLTKQMRDALKKEFNDPSELNVKDIRDHTPLVYAFVLETLRLSESVRVNLPRVLAEDLTLEEYGYTIPKGSFVSLNLYAIQRDTRDFEKNGWGSDALDFKPNRWIGKDGRIDKRMKDRVMAFSIGPRDCPGAKLAKEQLILLLSHFVWRFNIEYTGSNLPLLTFNELMVHSTPFPLKFTLCS